MRILVVEDEGRLNKNIVRGLEDHGFAVDSATDGEEGEKLARTNEYDAILLDILMPKRDGLAVCKNLRDSKNTTPIIFLTAKDSLEDRVSGLEGGADDYLVKPFSFEELVARIRTVLRRPRLFVDDIQELEGLRLDSRAQTLTVDGMPVQLTLREFALLEYLMRNRNTLLSRGIIQEHVWDQTFDSFSNVVDAHIKNLRKKLPSHYANLIETVRGKGYRISA
jgi:two-component system copper resistance phosphate regulon response regulator CusR